ncbi:MAG: response regulator [Atopobiaceae bacterium]|nr:response regulator [Atopobiaceae bacterium]
MNIILIVDDDTTSLKLAKGILDQEYRIATANSGPMVLKYLENNIPDLILLDINMPGMDGFEVMEALRSDPDCEGIPVIFLTASQDPSIEAQCLESGALDFVGKPFVPAVLKSRVRRVLELYGYRNQLETMVATQAEELVTRAERINRMQESIIVGMANLIELRDNNTGRHVKNTQTYVRMICEELLEKKLYSDVLTKEYADNTIKAAPLHDVGKIKISDTILNKPGKLTPEEFEVIKLHTVYGGEIVEDLLGDVEEPDYLKVAHDIALYHHERWDGTGYPTQISGEEIPLCARIMSVADVFDALYEERVYKKGIRPAKKALQIIEEGVGTQFDPTISSLFLMMEDKLTEYLGERHDGSDEEVSADE